jgi:hypothetical protein
MERCTGCGEALADFQAWCSLCFRKRTDRAELAADLRAAVSRSSWAPEDRFFAQPSPKRYARTRGGPISFGLLPKLALSLSIIVAGGFVLLMSNWNELYRNVTVVFVVLSGALFLRAIWRKERIE